MIECRVTEKGLCCGIFLQESVRSLKASTLYNRVRSPGAGQPSRVHTIQYSWSAKVNPLNSSCLTFQLLAAPAMVVWIVVHKPGVMIFVVPSTKFDDDDAELRRRFLHRVFWLHLALSSWPVTPCWPALWPPLLHTPSTIRKCFLLPPTSDYKVP